MRGAKRPRPVLYGQPLGAPLGSDILMPMPLSLTSVPALAEPCGAAAGLTWASQPWRQRVRTPEAGPLACARVRRGGFRPSVLRAHLRRRGPALSCQDGPDTHPSWGGDGRSLREVRSAGISGAEVRKAPIADVRGERFCGPRIKPPAFATPFPRMGTATNTCLMFVERSFVATFSRSGNMLHLPPERARSRSGKRVGGRDERPIRPSRV